MAIGITTVNNVSPQVISILVNEVALDRVSTASDLGAAIAASVAIPPGKSLTLETSRVDVGQLDQLRKKKLISYSST